MKEDDIVIRETLPEDIDSILGVVSAAFCNEKEPQLVKDLLEDSSAQPILSLLAFENEKPIGHILFTKVTVDSAENQVTMALLAPLAVVPEAQRRGVGGKLIDVGLKMLLKSGVERVFVLGHPEYYPKYGFKPAGCQGFQAPYPIPEECAGAWMVQNLGNRTFEKVSGKVICARALDKPEYWRE